MVQALLYFFLTLVTFILMPLNSFTVKIIVAIPFVVILGISLNSSKGKYRAGFSIGSITLLFGLLLGQVWKSYSDSSVIAIVVFVATALFSVIAIIGHSLYLLSQGSEKEIRIENKVKPKTFKERIEDMKQRSNGLKQMRRTYKDNRSKALPKLLSFQLAYAEYVKSLIPPEKNSMDFQFLKEVKYERNKYTVD